MKSIIATLFILIAGAAQADTLTLTCKMKSGNQIILIVEEKYRSSGGLTVYKGSTTEKLWSIYLSEIRGGAYEYKIDFGDRPDRFALELSRETGELTVWNAKYDTVHNKNGFDTGNCAVISREKTSRKF